MRLKELRVERGLNQTEFARKLGTTQSNISGWETGKWEADNTALQQIADFFGVTVDYLLGRSDSRTTPLPSDGVIEYPVIGSVRAGMGGNFCAKILNSTIYMQYMRNKNTTYCAQQSPRTSTKNYETLLFSRVFAFVCAKYLRQFASICAVLQNFVPHFVP